MPVLSFLLAGIVHYIKIPMIFLGTGIFSLLLLFLFKISRCGEFFDREISKLKIRIFRLERNTFNHEQTDT